MSVNNDLSTRRLRVTGGTISADGDIGRRSGNNNTDDVIIRSGGHEVNLSNIGGGGGGGELARL